MTSVRWRRRRVQWWCVVVCVVRGGVCVCVRKECVRDDIDVHIIHLSIIINDY